MMTAAADILIVVVVVYLYWPSLSGPFIYDDLMLWVASQEMRDQLIRTGQRPLAWFYMCAKRILRPRIWVPLLHQRPLTWTTYINDARCSGFNSFGFHCTNVIFHAVASMAVYHLFTYWLDPTSSLIGALLFAVHPLSTMAVAYIAGRSSLLCGMLILMCMLAFTTHEYVMLTLLSLLAALTKEEVVLLPILIGGLYWIR